MNCIVCHKPDATTPVPGGVPLHPGSCLRIAGLSVQLATRIPDETRLLIHEELETLYADVGVMTGKVMVEKIEAAADFLENHSEDALADHYMSEWAQRLAADYEGHAEALYEVIAALKRGD